MPYTENVANNISGNSKCTLVFVGASLHLTEAVLHKSDKIPIVAVFIKKREQFGVDFDEIITALSKSSVSGKESRKRKQSEETPIEK